MFVSGFPIEVPLLRIPLTFAESKSGTFGNDIKEFCATSVNLCQFTVCLSATHLVEDSSLKVRRTFLHHLFTQNYLHFRDVRLGIALYLIFPIFSIFLTYLINAIFFTCLNGLDGSATLTAFIS